MGGVRVMRESEDGPAMETGERAALDNGCRVEQQTVLKPARTHPAARTTV
jgi:hypothetical protein